MTAGPPDAPARPASPTLAVAIVSYESWPDATRLVASLAAEPGVSDGRCEVVVVDNASADPPPADPSWSAAGVHVIRRTDNAGFAAGVNTAWASTRARWLLLLNPDVVVGAGFVGRVLGRIAEAERRPGGAPGVVGFALRNADGSRQPSVGPWPSLFGCVREMLTPRSRRKYRPVGRTRPGPVPWATGACLLVRSDVLDAIGGMDDDFFLYHEEVALCRAARDRGFSVEFDDAVEVVHLKPLQGRSVGPKMRVITRHSKLLYFRKHRPAWEFAGLVGVVSLEAAIRGGLARLRGRPAECRAWTAVGAVARSMARGRGPVGTEVLAIAERAESGPGHRTAPGPSDVPGPHRRPGGRGSIALDRAGR